MSTVLADRFEITEPNRREAPFGIDRLTGARVLVVEAWPALRRGIGAALDVAAIRAMAERVVAMAHPCVARVLSVDPVVVEAGPALEAQPTLTSEEWLRIADELASTMEELFENGVSSIDPELAWVERGQDGRAEVRLPAPTTPPGLGIGGRNWRWVDHTGIAYWVEQRADSRALGKRLHARMERRAAARDDRPLTPTLDFDLGIRLGEEELDHLSQLAAREDWLPRVLRHGTMPLAAAYHHRACVAWSRGDRELALRDVSRAIELEAHARYLTTAALWDEARGQLDAAAEHHAQAVAALQPPPRRLDVGFEIIDEAHDPPERADRDATRTLLARAAFLARAGRYEDALADLEASIARKPTVSALVWLSSVRRKLGDRDGAIEAAGRALALDPTSAVALRIRALA